MLISFISGISAQKNGSKKIMALSMNLLPIFLPFLQKNWRFAFLETSVWWSFDIALLHSVSRFFPSPFQVKRMLNSANNWHAPTHGKLRDALHLDRFTYISPSSHVDVAQMCPNISRCPVYVIIQTFLITFVIPARNAQAILSHSYQTGAHCKVFWVFGESE